MSKDAPDLGPYRDLAKALKPLRIGLDHLGPDDEHFAAKWLVRLDD